VIVNTLDEKKKDKLRQELDCALSDKLAVYKKIVCAMDLQDLQSWSQKACKELSEKHKKEQAEIAEKKKSSSFASYFGWGSKPKEETKEELVPAD
jgi:hypothetical protein